MPGSLSLTFRKEYAPMNAALISVGGSATPILFSLRQRRPTLVWYFCSTGSRTVADTIHAQLDWRPDRDFIEVERFEELDQCYHALREHIPALLQKWRVTTADVQVDYTGGTKTMSAALVLAGVEFFDNFAYVGGRQRAGDGLGVTLDGSERAFYQTNPWVRLATREIERAADLWGSCLYEAAAGILQKTAARVPRKVAFETMASIAEAMGARHRLDFKRAQVLLGNARKVLEPLFSGLDDAGLMIWTDASLALCTGCASTNAASVLLKELLDNALRTGGQGRYEDAAARLYRAMEMQGQLWLQETSDGTFVQGKKISDKPLPSALSGFDWCQPNPHGDVVLGLESLYQAIFALGDKRGEGIVADLKLERKSQWRAATSKRNHSILAHGTSPIGADGFNAMKKLASEFLGFDLSKEANPIPPLDHRWL